MYGCFKELTTRHPPGKVNVYTMDHRGTGKSTHLQCEKTQAAASELQDPTDLDPPRIPACAKELEERCGDLAAFSTTSAAMDLASFISDYGNDFSTTVYGLKYGSLWVERLMHLNPPEVTGYVLDVPTTTSGAALESFYNESSSDVAFSEVADAFLDLCSEDSECNEHFGKKGLKATLTHLKARLDKNPTSTCAKLVTRLEYGEKTDPPSMALQNILGTLLGDMTMRTLIPPIVYRFLRCSKKDVGVLTYFVGQFNKGITSKNPDLSLETTLLLNLVVFSEMWESPTPSVSTMKTRFQRATLGSGVESHTIVPKYCAYSKEKSVACNKLKLGNYEGNEIIYERDEYWNKAAKIPKQASVLVMSSELDPLAPYSYAKVLLETLGGATKELVNFKSTIGAHLIDSITTEPMCGMALLASFVQSGGDLTQLNRACLDDEVALNWTTQNDIQEFFFGTDDVYDGSYIPA